MCRLKQDATVESVRDALKEFQVTSGLPWSDIARKLNKSAALVSQFAAGKYGGNIEDQKSVFIEFLNREHKRRLEKIEIPYCNTSHTAGVLAVCNLVHESGVIGLVHGSSGYGKTMALEMYANQNQQTLMITAYNGITSGAMLMDVVDLLGLKPNISGDRKRRKNYYGNQGYLVKMIVDELKGKDILLIVDEAHHLQIKQFDQIRYIHDVAKIPVIYAGNDEIIERMVGKQQLDYDQIYSRVPIVKYIDNDVIKSDVVEIVEKTGVKTDDKIIKFLVKKANERGHYRKMINILKNAIKFSIKENNPLNMVHFLSAEELLLGKKKLMA